MESDIAWLAFKHTLFSHIDKYFPSISVKSDFTSHGLTLNASRHIGKRKEHIKSSKKILGLKTILKILSKASLNLSIRDNCSKIYVIGKLDNLYNEDDPVLITKKFWSHVKSNSKSSR